ncbi:MAG TPA: glycosyltransferase family 2 protein [Candidatus Bathyarchaeia archaeon]|nr:glycosyltransferase family 2 protein [Candidatus Bathyarchaeia archaeon]
MIMLIILAIVGVVNLAVLLKLRYAFRLLRVPTEQKMMARDLPTVSVCITARNETHAMTQCLERVVASDYPKLEIIVLDDGSRDGTSLLIKSFAHAGVRFVEGKELPDGWLGKNYAQSILADEASGKYIFFMDVDTLIERHTVARTVDYMLQYQARMVSIVPIRDDHWQTSSLMTTMRYFWALMRFMPNRPRAVANAWLIERQLILDQLATDTSLQLSVQLETVISRKLVPERKYRLMMSSAWLGLRYEKSWESQAETSIRLLYPQCNRNLLQVVGLLLLLGLMLVPYVAVWWQPWAWAVIVLQYLVALYYLSTVWSRFRLVGALLMPVTIAQEITLLIISTYRYNFGVITWKGRPIQHVH